MTSHISSFYCRQIVPVRPVLCDRTIIKKCWVSKIPRLIRAAYSDFIAISFYGDTQCVLYYAWTTVDAYSFSAIVHYWFKYFPRNATISKIQSVDIIRKSYSTLYAFTNLYKSTRLPSISPCYQVSFIFKPVCQRVLRCCFSQSQFTDEYSPQANAHQYSRQ